MATQLENSQADLFEATPPKRSPTFPPAQRTQLLEQIQTLLNEAMTPGDTRETGDEQDRP